MIDDWLSEDGLKEIEIMGWPEWPAPATKSMTYRLGRTHNLWFIRTDDTDAPNVFVSRYISPHEALCLLRNHAAEYLRAHNAPMYIYCDDQEVIAAVLAVGVTK